MAQNVPSETGDVTAPPTTADKAIPGIGPPTVDGKPPPAPRNNVIPLTPPTPPKGPETQSPTPPGDKPKVPDDKAKAPEPPKSDKRKKSPAPKKSTTSKSKKEAAAGSKKTTAPEKQAQPKAPAEPTAAPRHGEKEEIVYLKLSELRPFKGHPFQVRKDEEMQAMVSSVKDKGVTQPAIVRPRKGGGYEMVSGHRRQQASKLAGFFEMPCIVRNLTDEQAITQMVEDNTNQREVILPSERAKALKMQLNAIKRQGVRSEGDKGQRSNEIVAERNKMTVKQVQRYIKLNDLVPELMTLVDNAVKYPSEKSVKKIGFTPAVELAFIGQKNQEYIALTIESQQSTPSLSQARQMRKFDQENKLTPDTIDGIMLDEKKKEVDSVILSSQELAKYFGNDKTPRQMKDTILQLLEEYKAKQPPEHTKSGQTQDNRSK